MVAYLSLDMNFHLNPRLVGIIKIGAFLPGKIGQKKARDDPGFRQ
jgi:hypothetical protein